MIPKKIHYCWLSGEPYPCKIRYCMDSWRRMLDGYEFVLWDSSRASEIDSKWLKSAIREKKWAFAADYIRIWALYSEGGVYLDSDVEILRNVASLLDRPLLLGEEGGTGLVEAAVMGAEAYHPTIKKVLDSFTGEVTDETLPQRMSRIVGMEVKLLDSSVFSPKDWRTGKINITEETYAIHHFAGTWLSAKERWAQRMGRLLGPWAIPCTRWAFNKVGK